MNFEDLKKEVNSKTRILIRNWPLLRLYIEIPFVSIRTHLMGYAMAEDSYEYVAIELRIHKWKVTFMLYKNRIWK